MTPQDIDNALHKAEKNQYGNHYDAHYIEQYKLFVEMADRISNRRQSANSFFLSVNTAIIVVLGYFQSNQTAENSQVFYLLASVAGMVLCYTWYCLIQSYKKLNTAKFKVILALEQKLPTAPYDAEWELLQKGENPKFYLPLTNVENNVPWVFLLLYLLIIIYNLFSVFGAA